MDCVRPDTSFGRCKICCVTCGDVLWVQVLCLSLWPILAFGQSSDLSRNLDACNSGSQSCDRSQLSASQLADVTFAGHGRNVINCRNGYSSCDLAKLTEPETMALAAANHQRNVSDCSDGMQSCDRSKLTPLEARKMETSQRQRNLAACRD